MPAYVGAIDQGTTSTRFIVFDRSGRIVSSAQKEHEQIYPQTRMGRARSRRNLASHAGSDRRSDAQRSICAPEIWPPSASPTSAKPPSSGIADR